ncbi:MAG TPA: radical SAM protein [Spirochaetota bacterium]|nr:radical SAM protein [Spirochaetota bacterium]HPC40027.1 radical SAM protein [Spirochaetota bacterium]HPL15196.1 radical SAM protein [Spirochaetota bacterium]HQJ71981.1 radical SAM protein [Spirochaetota bacterium]HRS76745.1 radical SAM protein [Spirochaetota bacterium]
MDYVGHVIRPPSEAYSMIIQVTVGCSHNMCTFCGTYKEQKFRVKDMATIRRDIDEASRYRFDRVFLADGDVLILPTATLLDIIAYIKKKNRRVERIGVYANTKAIIKKTPAELKELKEAGIGIMYQGIESGNKEVLRRIKKGAFPVNMKEAAAKVKESGILLSQTVLLGIGGTEMSMDHARDTGKLLGEMSPDFASALTVMLLPNTELYQAYRSGTFKLPDKFGLLEELKIIVENMDVSNQCLFTSNHASNYLPIRAVLPDQKAEVLNLLDHVLKERDENLLKPEYMRAL